jgi:predicted RNase H-like HicB family nuclease
MQDRDKTLKLRIGNKKIDFIVPIIIEWDEVNYHVYSPALKGYHTDGETEQEALKNAKKMARDFLKVMIEDGIPIPSSIILKGHEQPTKVRDQTRYHEIEISIELE